MSTCRPFVPSCVALATLGLALSLPVALAAQDPSEAKTWEGTWSNRKYNTTGPLRCVATKKDDSSADATFSGTFMRDPFSYKVVVTTRQERNQTLLTGTATLDGDRYEWSGVVRGNVLSGQYRSLKGNNGEFQLREVQK